LLYNAIKADEKWFKNLRLGSRARHESMKKHSIHGCEEYVSILKRLATQPLGFRWGFETASKRKEHKT
jgi:hypothetical protein